MVWVVARRTTNVGSTGPNLALSSGKEIAMVRSSTAVGAAAGRRGVSVRRDSRCKCRFPRGWSILQAWDNSRSGEYRLPGGIGGLMALTAWLGTVAEHWMLTVLVLCPIVIVTMALAALSCEVCGAPFGVFRRRNRTIDLCLRCALLHDIRRAKDKRLERDADTPGPAADGPNSTNGPEAQERRAERREERVRTMELPIQMGAAGGSGPR